MAKPKPLLARKLVSPLAALVDDRLSHPERWFFRLVFLSRERQGAFIQAESNYVIDLALIVFSAYL